MSKIEIETTDDNAFNAGWLGYLLGLPQPDSEDDPEGAMGWRSGLSTPTVKTIRDVFTRQHDAEQPLYIVRPVLPDKVMTTSKAAASE